MYKAWCACVSSREHVDVCDTRVGSLPVGAPAGHGGTLRACARCVHTGVGVSPSLRWHDHWCDPACAPLGPNRPPSWAIQGLQWVSLA